MMLENEAVEASRCNSLLAGTSDQTTPSAACVAAQPATKRTFFFFASRT